jgi:hypothetical protein
MTIITRMSADTSTAMHDLWVVTVPIPPLGRGDYAVLMSSPAVPVPTPTLLAPSTARSIRDALVGAERAEFEERFALEMAEAARTLDLTGVLAVLEIFRKIAAITQRQGPAAQRRMIDQAARLSRGEDVPTIPGNVHKAEIAARMSR